MNQLNDPVSLEDTHNRPSADRAAWLYNAYVRSRKRAAPFVARCAWIGTPLLLYAATRVLVFAVALVANVGILNPGMMADVYSENHLLDMWSVFDATHYLIIAHIGYYNSWAELNWTAFFPVLPLATHLLIPIVGNGVLAGLVFVYTCVLGAFLLLYRLALLEFGDEGAARRALLYLALAPSAVFLSAVYTEGPFLLFAIGAFYFARTRRWFWAGIFGLAASATRSIGIILFPLAVLMWLQSTGWTLEGLFRREGWTAAARAIRAGGWFDLFMIGLMPLGLLGYMLYLHIAYGNALLFVESLGYWARSPGNPVETIWSELHSLATTDWRRGIFDWALQLRVMNLATLLGVLTLAPFIWRRLGAAYGLYTLLAVLIPASSDTTSMMRYALVAFPVMMMLAWWGRRAWLDRVVSVTFAMFMAAFLSMFINNFHFF